MTPILYFLSNVVSHQDIGNDIQNLVMATAAAGGAMGHGLYVLEGLQYVLKAVVLVECIGNIRIADLLAITDHIVFCHLSLIILLR